MGKTYLTQEELDQFETIENLMRLSTGKDETTWGLCQNIDNEFSYTEPGEEWSLCIPLRDIYEEAHVLFGEHYRPNAVKVVFAYEIYPDNYVEFELINTDFYEEDMHQYYSMEWDAMHH